MDKKLKHSADIFIQAAKQNKEVYDDLKKMIHLMDLLGVSYNYTYAALAQRGLDKNIQPTQDKIAKFIADNKFERGTAMVALINILGTLIPQESLDMVEYILDSIMSDNNAEKSE